MAQASLVELRTALYELIDSYKERTDALMKEQDSAKANLTSLARKLNLYAAKCKQVEAQAKVAPKPLNVIKIAAKGNAFVVTIINTIQDVVATIGEAFGLAMPLLAESSQTVTSVNEVVEAIALDELPWTCLYDDNGKPLNDVLADWKETWDFKGWNYAESEAEHITPIQKRFSEIRDLKIVTMQSALNLTEASGFTEIEAAIKSHLQTVRLKLDKTRGAIKNRNKMILDQTENLESATKGMSKTMKENMGPVHVAMTNLEEKSQEVADLMDGVMKFVESTDFSRFESIMAATHKNLMSMRSKWIFYVRTWKLLIGTDNAHVVDNFISDADTINDEGSIYTLFEEVSRFKSVEDASAYFENNIDDFKGKYLVKDSSFGKQLKHDRLDDVEVDYIRKFKAYLDLWDYQVSLPVQLACSHGVLNSDDAEDRRLLVVAGTGYGKTSMYYYTLRCIRRAVHTKESFRTFVFLPASNVNRQYNDLFFSSFFADLGLDHRTGADRLHFFKAAGKQLKDDDWRRWKTTDLHISQGCNVVSELLASEYHLFDAGGGKGRIKFESSSSFQNYTILMDTWKTSQQMKDQVLYAYRREIADLAKTASPSPLPNYRDATGAVRDILEASGNIENLIDGIVNDSDFVEGGEFSDAAVAAISKVAEASPEALNNLLAKFDPLNFMWLQRKLAKGATTSNLPRLWVVAASVPPGAQMLTEPDLVKAVSTLQIVEDDALLQGVSFDTYVKAGESYYVPRSLPEAVSALFKDLVIAAHNVSNFLVDAGNNLINKTFVFPIERTDQGALTTDGKYIKPKVPSVQRANQVIRQVFTVYEEMRYDSEVSKHADVEEIFRTDATGKHVMFLTYDSIYMEQVVKCIQERAQTGTVALIFDEADEILRYPKLEKLLNENPIKYMLGLSATLGASANDAQRLCHIFRRSSDDSSIREAFKDASQPSDCGVQAPFRINVGKLEALAGAVNMALYYADETAQEFHGIPKRGSLHDMPSSIIPIADSNGKDDVDQPGSIILFKTNQQCFDGTATHGGFTLDACVHNTTLQGEIARAIVQYVQKLPSNDVEGAANNILVAAKTGAVSKMLYGALRSHFKARVLSNFASEAGDGAAYSEAANEEFEGRTDVKLFLFDDPQSAMLSGMHTEFQNYEEACVHIGFIDVERYARGIEFKNTVALVKFGMFSADESMQVDGRIRRMGSLAALSNQSTKVRYAWLLPLYLGNDPKSFAELPEDNCWAQNYTTMITFAKQYTELSKTMYKYSLSSKLQNLAQGGFFDFARAESGVVRMRGLLHDLLGFVTR